MKQYVLKSIVSSIILIGHFSIIILIFAMYFRSGFTFSEATTTISVFLPITSVYTSAIIKDIIANKEIDQRTQKKIFPRILHNIMYNIFNVYSLSSYDYHHKGL
jgi:hypothetical protein